MEILYPIMIILWKRMILKLHTKQLIYGTNLKRNFLKKDIITWTLA